MSRKRKQYDPPFKAKVALAGQFQVHPSRSAEWKRQLLWGAADLFGRDRRRERQDQKAWIGDLYQQIGRLQMELAWRKKNLPRSAEGRRAWIEPHHGELSIRRQGEPVGLNRSSWYYDPGGETPENLELMRRIDEPYLQTPFYGSRKMAKAFQVNRKRIQRLMRLMGLEAISPKPRLTQRHPEHRVYPSLRRGGEVVRPNQVGSSDITYVPLRQGFLYLTVILAWYRRYVLSWRRSNPLDGGFCLDALEGARERQRPEIFNGDPGAQ